MNRFVADLNATTTEAVANDTMSFSVTVHAPAPANTRVAISPVVFTGKLVFEDPVRANSAKSVCSTSIITYKKFFVFLHLFALFL